MTRPEIMELDPGLVVIIPLGSTEQHGLHLPVDTDTRIAEAVCREAEKRNRDRTLLAPVIWMGHSPHHLGFGGTVSLDHNVYTQMLTCVVTSFIGMGFKKIFLVNGHGGNGLPVSMTQQEIKLLHPETMLCAANYWELGRETILKHRDGGKYSMGHAGELETSLYMYLYQSGVRKELIRDAGRTDDSGYFGMGMFNGGPVSYLSNFSEFTDTGAFGCPEKATPEKGRIYFEAVCDGMDRFINCLYEKEKFF